MLKNSQDSYIGSFEGTRRSSNEALMFRLGRFPLAFPQHVPLEGLTFPLYLSPPRTFFSFIFCLQSLISFICLELLHCLIMFTCLSPTPTPAILLMSPCPQNHYLSFLVSLLYFPPPSLPVASLPVPPPSVLFQSFHPSYCLSFMYPCLLTARLSPSLHRLGKTLNVHTTAGESDAPLYRDWRERLFVDGRGRPKRQDSSTRLNFRGCMEDCLGIAGDTCGGKGLW